MFSFSQLESLLVFHVSYAYTNSFKIRLTATLGVQANPVVVDLAFPNRKADMPSCFDGRCPFSSVYALFLLFKIRN